MNVSVRAASGIGRALALGLGRRGARLAISDVDEDGLAETGRLLAGGEVHEQRLDVSEREGFERYAASVVELTYADYERVLSINLWGVIHGTKAFLPHSITSGDGHVVNVSSLNGYMAYPALSAYCASKFAVRGFSGTLRIEMLQARLPVRVSVVHPGGVRTNITANSRAAAAADGIEHTAAEQARSAAYDERFLRLGADTAAETILAGVAAGKGRILVGRDAQLIDKLVRLLPALYPRVVARLAANAGGH